MSKRIIAALAFAVILSGCGKSPVTSSRAGAPALSAAVEAQATRTLLTGFKHIHMAVFTKIDVNADKSIDEYEAGKSIDLNDFTKADKNRNGKLTQAEFMNYATAGELFAFIHQNKKTFMKETRDVLWRAFLRLDADKDRALSTKELSQKALAKIGISLRIDGLRTNVGIKEIDEEVFAYSDKTKDGVLGQAEFEDYCITSFVKSINPKYNIGGNPEPAPDPAPADPADPAPADPGTGGGEEPASGGEEG
jgi:hypothetical protein